MKLCVHIVAVAALAGSLAAGTARADGYKFTTVDGPVPNDGGTQLAGINNSGTIVGNDFDRDSVEHGLIATPSSAP